MDAGLDGKVFLVTGASGGIGQAMARTFVDERAQPVLHFHRGEDRAHALRAELGAGRAIAADLCAEGDVEALIDAAVRHYGQLDGAVVNAGIWEPNPVPVVDMSLGQWQRTLEVNLTGAFLTCRAYLRYLKEARPAAASIVLVGSTAAVFGEADHADYAASKAGLAYGLMLSLKNEIVRLSPRGRVNAVSPGWVATPMAAAALADPAMVERAQATMSLRKVATPQDVARAVVFLSSERLAGHLSGVHLPVAGGMEGRQVHP